jgi:Rap1a immunity proteins
MKYVLLALIVMEVALAKGVGATTKIEDFQVGSTKNLLNLCTVAADDPLYKEAIHFCHGYLVGAFHYYKSQETGPGGSKFLCLPETKPSRNETIEKFIAWAEKHPEYENEVPVETEFRFLTELWACKSRVDEK